MYPKKKLAQLVISICHQYAIDTVVISPGSRNAPLTIGFSNHPSIETLSVVDERCAAFFAMGIAQQKQKPVAVVCSSGSALLNYYPAISEAFYSQIPLVVISADRPKNRIDIGDGQTIRQENVFENHILFSANLVEGNEYIIENKEKVSKALQNAIQQKGPVHINVPFDEPLYETVDTLQEYPVIKEQLSILNFEKESIDYYTSIWNSASKKMILVGSNFPNNKLQQVLDRFIEEPSVLVLTETTSNVYHKKFINSIDKLIFPLKEEELKDLQPEVLLTLGGMVVSKKIKQFLRTFKPSHHWHLDELKVMDTYQCLSSFIQVKPVTFLRRLYNKTLTVQSTYQSYWLQIKEERAVKHKMYLEKCEYSDLKAFEAILNTIPNKYQFQISNSSTIRYSLLFDVNPTLNVFCNRGTSGIDGSTSTAIGAAYTNEKPTVFVTGDLSFFYDSNALWNANIPTNFRIIILNNGGGGIFRFIPGPLTTNATNYFETPHNLTAEYLAKMYNFEYDAVRNLNQLDIKLRDFYENHKQPRILEVFTPKEVNDVVLKNYFKSL